MQITPEDLLREAADMALEIRIKDRIIATLQAELEKGHEHTHTHEAPEGGES